MVSGMWYMVCVLCIQVARKGWPFERLEGFIGQRRQDSTGVVFLTIWVQVSSRNNPKLGRSEVWSRRVGMWFVVCGMWYVVWGMWYVVCGMWYVVCGMWYVVCGMCFFLCFSSFSLFILEFLTFFSLLFFIRFFCFL